MPFSSAVLALLVIFIMITCESASGQVQEEWVARYSGASVESIDSARAVAADALGNVYVTGDSSGSGTGYDYVTIKYNASGKQLWVARYNGPDNFNDSAIALAVDAYGNVYVTGDSEGPFEGNDQPTFSYATIKYDSNGNQLWVARATGSLNYASALAVDAAGNVYVTGFGFGFGSTGFDYLTIKYDASGNEQWFARYSGQGSYSEDHASALAVDAAGNVYVTGYSREIVAPGTGDDYTTIKYDANGHELWVARYNGPDNLSDQATALAVDASGNVYVTGYSEGPYEGNDQLTTSYATIKYDASGNQLWVARYNRPGDGIDRASALSVDAAGNVSVTGFGYVIGTRENDYLTIKYDTGGNQLWVARYPGIGAYALSVDAAGNAYVTGDSGTIKYNANGNELWVATPGGLALSVDAAGNAYVTGDSIGDYATIKLDSSGNELWEAYYSGLGKTDNRVAALAVDASGNAYVTGNSCTIKYDSNGGELWVAPYGRPFSLDGGNAITIDGTGNVYVTGYCLRVSTGADFATVKYDSSGHELWVARYNGPDILSDQATALAVDAAGNVYVTGNSAGLGTGGDYATIKYDASGNQLWVARFSGPGNSDDNARAIAVDAIGNVYVTGSSMGAGTGTDYATIKYDASGSELWVVRFSSPGNSDDYPNALALDSVGNVYVTGSNQSGAKPATIKYDSSGNELWVAYFQGVDAKALAVDAEKSVYVTGASSGFATIKYDDSGNQLWVASYSDPASDSIGKLATGAQAIALDSEGNVYVTGWVFLSDNSADFGTIKYDNKGNQVWVARYNGSEMDMANAIALDGQGNVYVTGSSGEWHGANDYITIKLTQTDSGEGSGASGNNGGGGGGSCFLGAISY
jgi:uncharacterized delta-60 repeat protein